MNAPLTLTPLREFTPGTYSQDSYIFTPEDFIDGCFIRTVNGKPYGTGRTVLGDMRTIPLNVPLCKGCGQVIVDHLCPDCLMAFLDEPEGKAA